jgi:outer membrane cobalamin receptor
MKSLALPLLIASTLAVGAARANEPDDTQLIDMELQGRPVIGVLDDFEKAGYRFVFSRSLIRPNTHLRSAPDAGRPIDRLRSALQDIGLSFSQEDNGTLFIVPFQRPPQPLMGRITDARSGEPLPGVRVELGTLVVFTDEAGRFQVPNPQPVPISISRDGYRATLVSARQPLEDLLEIPLYPHSQIEEVVVTSSRYALKKSAATSLHSLDHDDLNSIPELGDDALRAAVHLPGTATNGLSAKPYIRGGLQDETLVLFNNVELLEPFHLKDFQSVFSGLNPTLIKSIDVYTGGFPARYGDRMSGVMDIDPTDEYSGIGADLSLSFLTASAAVYGTSHEGRGEWALSGRRGNLDIVTDQINSTVGDPSYSDWFGRFSWALTPSSELEFGSIVYDDDIQFKDLDGGAGELANSRYRNAYAWVQVHKDWSSRLSSSTLASFGSIRHDRDGFVNDPDSDEGSGTLNDQRAFNVWSLVHHQNYEHNDTLSFEFGGRLNYQKGRYDTVVRIERGELAQFLGIETTEVRDITLRPQGASGGIYASTRFRPRPWMTLEGGLRWDFQDYGLDFEQQVSPRFSVLFDAGSSTQIRASAGKFHQPEAIHELQAADGLDKYQKPQFADHFILGLNHQFGDTGFSSRIETFYKKFQDPKQRFENVFNSIVLLPELMSDRVAVVPESARSRGIETTLRYQHHDNLKLWLSYTRASADDKIEGRWRQRGWDQRHTVSSGVVWNYQHWLFSGSLLWHSGWQTTALPAYIGEDERPQLRRNDERLPHFLSLDIRVSRTWEWPRQAFVVFLEVTNATNRQNVGAYEYELEEDEENGGFFVIAEEETLLPLIPSIGLRWTFN